MPDWVQDEDKWKKAKKLADESGHKDDYDYITGIYKKMGGKIKGKESYKERLNALHSTLVLKEQAYIDGEGSETTRTGGGHIHNDENPDGLHSHPELEEMILALKSDIEYLKQPL